MRVPGMVLSTLVVVAACGAVEDPAPETLTDTLPCYAAQQEPVKAPPPTRVVGAEVLHKESGFYGGVHGGLAVFDGTVYFNTFYACSGDESALWAMPVVGGEAKLLWAGKPKGSLGFGMAVADHQVIWSGAIADGTSGIFATPLEGGRRRVLGRFNSKTAAIRGVAAVGTMVYGATLDEIVSVPLSGGPVKTIYQGSGGDNEIASQIVVRPPSIYFTTGNAFMRVDIEGGTPSVVAQLPLGRNWNWGFAIGSVSAYIGSRDGVDEVALDTGKTLRSFPIGPVDVIVAADDALYATVVYETGFTTIFKVPLTPNVERTLLATNLSYVFGLVHDDGKLYFAQCSCAEAGFIGRIDLADR